MKLRQQAMALDMQVQLKPLPMPRGTPPSQEVQGAAYRLNRIGSQKDNFRKHITYIVGRSKTDPSIWEWFNPVLAPDQTTAKRIITPLQNLPEDASIVESTPTTTSVYWQENGTIEDVKKFYQCLLKFQQCEAEESFDR